MMTMTAFVSDGSPSSCPAEFSGFYHAEWALDKPCVLNDSVHLIVKIIWRMMKKNMAMGDHRVSKAYVLDMLQVYGKATTGIDPSVITDLKDAMNYERAAKLCSSTVYNLLDNDDQKATRIFLKIATYVNLSLVDPSLLPEERISKLWYAVFFCRFWRISTKSEQGKTLKNDFLSANAYSCLEINAHNFLKFLVQCREKGKPELFLPYEANSQTCENVFRGFRSQGSSDYTSVNFNISEMLYRSRRAAKIVEIQSSTAQSFHSFETTSFLRKLKAKNRFVPRKLPSNSDVKALVDLAFREALVDAATIGIDVEGYSNQNLFDVATYPAHGLSITAHKESNKAKPNESCENNDDVNLNTDNNDDIFSNGQINEHEIFLGDVLKTDFIEDLSDPPAPRGFVKVQGRVNCLRKSFVLWCLLQKQEKLSQDRLRRFMESKKKIIRQNDYIFIAQFAKMILIDQTTREKNEEFVYVLGFRALSGTKLDIPHTSMPLSTANGKPNSSVGALVNLYKIKEDSEGYKSLTFFSSIKEPVSLKYFIRHVENIELYDLFGR